MSNEARGERFTYTLSVGFVLQIQYFTFISKYDPNLLFCPLVQQASLDNNMLLLFHNIHFPTLSYMRNPVDLSYTEWPKFPEALCS